MYYFAYAANLNKKQMQERCWDSRSCFTATLPNYKIIFSGWSRQWRGGIATIKASRGDKIRGAVYEVNDACLRQLDRHEAGYTRINVNVFDEDNQAIAAVTYIKSGHMEESTPSREYGEIIRQGYRDWGIA